MLVKRFVSEMLENTHRKVSADYKPFSPFTTSFFKFLIFFLVMSLLSQVSFFMSQNKFSHHTILNSKDLLKEHFRKHCGKCDTFLPFFNA